MVWDQDFADVLAADLMLDEWDRVEGYRATMDRFTLAELVGVALVAPKELPRLQNQHLALMRALPRETPAAEERARVIELLERAVRIDRRNRRKRTRTEH